MRDEKRIESWKRNSIIVDGHWRYQGHKVNGYGQVRFNGRNMHISRASAILFLGLSMRDTRQANHKRTCPYRDCWNPDCIYIGTPSENAYDTVALRRHSGQNQWTARRKASQTIE